MLRKWGVAAEDVATDPALEAKLDKAARSWINRNGYEPSGFRTRNSKGVPEEVYMKSNVVKKLAQIEGKKPDLGILTAMNSIAKTVELSLSPFHFWALAMNSVAYGNNPMQVMGKKGINKTLSAPDVEEAIRSGLTMGTSDLRNYRAGYNTLFEESANPFSRSAKMGKTGKVLTSPWTGAKKAKGFIDRALWDQLHVGTKLLAWRTSKRYM